MTVQATSSPVATLLAAHDAYRPARERFFTALGKSTSNRDPLAEFSEQLVTALMRGLSAGSRIQPANCRVQVRYLANPPGVWINEHLVQRIPGVPLNALVLFENFVIVGVLVFPTDNLARICAALGKRHGRQHETLQFTRRNWHTVRSDAPRFRKLGMRVWLPPIDTSIAEPPRPAPVRSAALRVVR